MRIALVSPYSLTAPGGVQGQVLALARALSRAGHEAWVLGPVDGPLGDVGLPPDAVVSVGGSVPVPANGSVARLALGPMVMRRTMGALRHRKPDVVHVHEPLAPGPTWAALFGRDVKVGTFHRSGPVIGNRILQPAARAATARLTLRTAVSGAARETAVALAGGEYEIVGNGVELERFRHAKATLTRGPTVLFIGRHEERKGLAVLLRAWDALSVETDVRLWVAGEGPETKALRERHGSSNRIEWLGRISDEELAERMAAADVLCAPSLHGESFGIVLVEGLAARCVVVASDLPGYGEVLGSYGVLVPPGDAEALAAALAGVVADVRGVCGQAAADALDAAALHAEQWSMDVIARKYAEVYERAVRSGAGH